MRMLLVQSSRPSWPAETLALDGVIQLAIGLDQHLRSKSCHPTLLASHASQLCTKLPDTSDFPVPGSPSNKSGSNPLVTLLTNVKARN